MEKNKLCLLLLFAIFTLSKAQDKGDSDVPCLMDKRYKSFHKYEYHYETESLNALNGANNGARVSCKVEIKVPGPCSYIMHTSECTLSEVNDVNTDGKPVFGPAAGTENFKAAMEKHHLKFTVESDNDIKLFPEEDELINILNIKRGIISALAVPLLEEEKNKDMPTIYGLCPTDYTVNTSGNIATNITLNRDLSQCDKFRPIKDHTSPLAIITGMHHRLAQLIRSTETCNYIFDNEKHHMTSGVCIDKHLLEPFSHKEVGMTNFGKQTVTLLGVTKYDDRVFNHNVANMKPLHPDSSVDMSPVQDKDAVIAVVSELALLSKSSDGHKRAHLAHKLVAVIRRMNAETLTAAVPEALKISQSLTYQALLQCGSPECNRAIMQVFKTWDRSSFEVDAALYGMGLMPRPSRVLVGEMLEMAKLKPSKPIYYAVSNAVTRLYDTEGVTSEIQSVAAHILERIGDCTGDQENIFLSLRVTGNMAAAMEAASSALMSAVIQCINQPVASPAVQRAAVQVFRQIPVPEEGREVLMHVVLDGSAAIQKRVAAYLIVMKDPRSAELARLASALNAEGNLQAKSFIISHISNILSSTAPETVKLRQKILDAFQGNEVGTLMDPSKFSRFYQMGSLEGNMIFESPEELPREVMLDMTLNAFGFDMDLVEIGMEGKGFEPLVESLFGANGFFPDTAMKTIFYAANKMPIQVNDVLNNIVPGLRNDRKKRQATQSILREISQNVNKLIENMKTQDAPEALVYLRLLGAELGYLQTKDMEEMSYTAGKLIKNLPKMLPNDFLRRLFSSVDNDFFLHYIFMDNEFYLPTGSGFPLRVALSGVFTAGIKGGLNFDSHMGEFAFMPSAGIELVTEFGAHFPDYVISGLEMHTNIYHESGVRAKLSMRNDQVKITVPVPQDPTKIISITNLLVSVIGGKSKTIPFIGKRVDEEQCSVFFPGLKYCKSLQYYEAISNDSSPNFLLNGDKFNIELQATGEVTGYTATITYDSVDEMDMVTVGVKADGTSFEGTATLKLNRQMYMASAEFLFPTLHVESKVTANVKQDEELTVEFECDLILPATTSVQKLTLKYDGKKIEADVKSNVSAEIQSIISNSPIEAMVNSLLDDQNQINISGTLAKLVENLGVPLLDEISFPERLFFNVEAAVKYTFGDQYKTMTLILPSAGISAKEVIIPESILLHVPTLGTAEVSGKLDSNFYNLEADVFVGRDPVEHTSYSAKAKVTGTSPVDLLSVKVEGSAMVESKHGDSVDAYLKTAVNHQLMDVRVSVVEELKFTEKTSLKSISKLEVTSPIGVQISLKHIGQVGVDAEKVSGNGNLEGSIKAGQEHGSAILTQSVSLLLVRPEAKIETSLKTNSTLYAQSTINAAFTNGELSIRSNTALYKDYLSNIAELTFKESQIALKSDTKSSALGLKIQNKAEAQAGADAFRAKIETSVDLSEERVHSLITGALDANGLMVNSDASARLTGLAASHKANLIINNDGLSSGGTTSLKSLLTLDEVQHTFDISYKNLIGTAMCKTTGGIMGMQIRHNTELEIAGHVGRFKNQINLLSEDFRFDTTTHGTASPFRFSIDAVADGHCNMDVFGMQLSQFRTEAQLKAEPFAFAHSHHCRVSSNLELARGVFIQTNLENSFDTVLNLAEQKSNLTVKCEVNDYALSQRISAFNNPERLGLEGSGSIVANNQDVSISGFLKYDKKSDGGVTNLPIIASWSKTLDDIRMNLLRTFEALRNYINSENIAFKIENIPQVVSNIVSGLNFEGRVVQLKHYLVALTQNMPESVLTLEDMEDSLINLIDAFEKLVTEMAYSLREELAMFNELVEGTILNNIVEKLTHEWNAFNRQYSISALIFTVIENVKRCLSVHTVKQLFNELDKPLIRSVNVVYGNVRALILKSEVDKIIVAVLDEMVEHIKQCKNDKTLHRLAHISKSIQIQITQFLDEAMICLRTNDVRQPGKHQNESSTPASPTINHFPQTPKIGLSFGKLYGEVNINSPAYSVQTSADVQDVSEQHSNFTASVTSQGTSPYSSSLNYNLDFKAQMSIPEQSQLRVSETLKITGFLIFDQQATLGVNTFASEDLPKQITKTSTSDFDAAHVNLGDERFLSFETAYNHQMIINALLIGNEITLNQKGVAYQKATTFILKLKNEGTGKFVLYLFSYEGTHKSKLNFNINLNRAKLVFAGTTESNTMKMKMTANAEGDAQSHYVFDARLETESPFIKNSLAVASGKVVLTDMNVEIRASHDTELDDVSGFLNNEVTIVISPHDVLIKFQNKGESPEAKLQNDFSVVLNPGIHQINTVVLVDFKQYYYRHNFTVMNIKEEAGVYTAVGGLYSPKYLFGQAFDVPFTEFQVPALKDLIFYEQTALWDDFVSTDQPIDFDAKLVLEKYKFAPSIPSGFIYSKMSFWSSVLSLNAYADYYKKEKYLMHVNATTSSKFEGLNAKLDGTTSVNTKVGFKVSTSLSLDNVHIGGSHDGSLTLDKDTYEAVMSVDTVAKINMPTFSVNGTHQLCADTKTHPKSTSDFKIKYSFDRPDSQGVGHGDAENHFKLEATPSFISIESFSKGTTNSTTSDHVMVQGSLANDASISVKTDGFQCTLRTSGNGIIGGDNINVGYDINDTLSIKGDLGRLYSLLEIDSNYEIFDNLKNGMKINHTALGKSDVIPLSSLVAAVEMITSSGMFKDIERDSETDWMDRRFRHKSKTDSHWYNSSLALSFEYFDVAPEVTSVFKGSYNLTSPSALLDYEFDIHSLILSP